MFTTSHKKTYLKWHAKLTGEGDKGQQRGAAAAGGGKPVTYTVSYGRAAVCAHTPAGVAVGGGMTARDITGVA